VLGGDAHPASPLCFKAALRAMQLQWSIALGCLRMRRGMLSNKNSRSRPRMRTSVSPGPRRLADGAKLPDRKTSPPLTPYINRGLTLGLI
jgi:hypothetical protein